jgi:hypothetical protein
VAATILLSPVRWSSVSRTVYFFFIVRASIPAHAAQVESGVTRHRIVAITCDRLAVTRRCYSAVAARHEERVMAKMYPERLLDDVPSEAEETLYLELQRQLPDEYVVLHSVKWLNRRPTSHDEDGEVDFLVVDPRRGLLIIEVKGGSIGRDGVSGRWYSTNRFGTAYPLGDPFAQATRNLHALVRKLREGAATKHHSYRLQRAVAFPDTVVGRQDLGVDIDRAMIIDSSDLNDLERAVRRALGSPGQKGDVSQEAVKALVEMLAPTWHIRRPGLVAQMKRSERKVLELTEQQYVLLDWLAHQPRGMVAGCAGSGKTFMAMEQARRLARQGFRVLFTCFNQALADWVRHELRTSLADVESPPYVDNYHDVAAEYVRRAGRELPDPDAMRAEEKSRYYNEELPAMFAEAVGSVPERFDAVIVDEAQDFSSGWWVTLLELLEDPDKGLLYIFHDSNQRIYSRDVAFPIPGRPFPLTANLRNTRAIHELAMGYHCDRQGISCKGPEGREPELIAVEPGKERHALRRVVVRLVREEGVPPEQIVVLTPRRSSSAFREGDDAGNNLRLTWGEAGSDRLRIRNVYAYKGLEAPVVILVEPEGGPDENREHMLYVALSRARHHLIVLGDLAPPRGGEEERETARQVALPGLRG